MTSSQPLSGERGASILELAIVAPLMILIVMGVLDLARAYRMQIQLEGAAREGAAYAQLYPNRLACAGVDITDRVLAEHDGLAALDGFRVEVFSEAIDGTITAPVAGCGTADVASGSRLRVDVSATFDVITPMVEHVVGAELDVRGSAQIRVQG